MNAYMKQIYHSLMLKNNPQSLYSLPIQESITHQSLYRLVKIFLTSKEMDELLAVEIQGFLIQFTMKVHKLSKKDYQRYHQQSLGF